MKDVYPRLDRLPHDWLVEPGDQPDYLDIPGVTLEEGTDLGSMLCDVQVERGRGGAVAIVHHETGVEMTFAQLAERSDRAAAAFFDVGVRPGDRVALRGSNCPDFIVAAIAAWKIGAVVALIPALARESELEFFLADTAPRLLVLMQTETPGVLALIGAFHELTVIATEKAGLSQTSSWSRLLDGAGPRPAVPADLDRVAVVWHTGGTTGQPKGCYHTQRRFLLGGLSLGLATGAEPGQRWAAAAPMGHALGFIHSTNFTLLNGVTLIVISGFTKPNVLLEAISEWSVTQFTAIAATWTSMLDLLENGEAPEPQTLLRGYAMWQSSSTSRVASGWLARGVELLNNFGSTSFATWILVPPVGAQVAQAWLGAAAPGYEVAAVETEFDDGVVPVAPGEPGQLAVRGPTGLTYWRLPDKQRTDVKFGYSLQDDLIRFGLGSTKDFAEYLGRTDFLVSTAGNKVAPAEVESALASHPSVRESVVFGLPDEVRKEIVAAYVVLHDPTAASDDLRRELQSHVKSQLAPYKYPRRLEFIDAIPRDTVGKVQTRSLRDRVLSDEHLRGIA